MLKPNASPKVYETRHLKRRAFLAAYSACGVVQLAAKAARVDRHAHYYWLAHDPQYAAAFAEARERAIEALEGEARRRAERGVAKPVIYKGELVMIPLDPNDPNSPKVPLIEHQYSDVLTMFLLKAARPDKYRENVKVVRVEHARPPTTPTPEKPSC